MGYYTKYSIHAIDLRPPESNLPINNADWFNEFGLAGYEKDDQIWHPTQVPNRFTLEEDHKWYNHEEELQEVSLSCQGIVFVLDGVGEENGDVWRKFFLNGAVYTWTLTIEKPPEFNDHILSELKFQELLDNV